MAKEQFFMLFRSDNMTDICRDINRCLTEHGYKVISSTMGVKYGEFNVLVFFEKGTKDEKTAD